MNNLVQTGNGKRGCRPIDLLLYLPNKAYCVCNVCDYPWRIPLDQFLLNVSESCRLCGEKWFDCIYIKPNEMLLEYRKISKLTQRRIIPTVYSGQNIPHGAPGLYKLDIFPANDNTSLFPEFTKIAYLSFPDNLPANPYFTRNMLSVLIDDSRAWKRAIFYIYKIRDAIPDL